MLDLDVPIRTSQYLFECLYVDDIGELIRILGQPAHLECFDYLHERSYQEMSVSPPRC